MPERDSVFPCLTGCRFVVGAAMLAASIASAHAQTVRCSKFLHNADGSWSSFEEGTFLGSRGPVAIKMGERFGRGSPAGKGEIARVLDGICLHDE